MTAPTKSTVTEHALLRYCERVMGADRAWIMQRLRTALPVKDGVLVSGRHPIEGGKFYAIVEDNCVITVLLPQEDFSKRHRARQLHRRYNC